MKATGRAGVFFVITVWIAVASLSISRFAGAQEEGGAGGVKPTPSPARYTGVKKRIAVAKFDVAAITAGGMGADIGGGVTAQLTTALVDSGHFVVLERAAMAEIQREQELETQRRAVPATEIQREQQSGVQRRAFSATASPALAPDPSAPDPSGPDPSARAVVAVGINGPGGKLIDAQVLIVGLVTEFEQAAKSGDLTIGVGGLFGPRLGRHVAEGHVGMDIRLVDTTNGQVLISKRVEARVPESRTSVNVSIRSINFGDETFKKTPLGMATRSAIEKAVALIIGEMEAVPWRGQVAGLLENQVLVNAGRDIGLQPGMIFVASSIAKEVTDPATGLSLGVIEERQGEIQVEQVQEKFSTARLVTGSLPKRGDLLRLKH